jgi:hypothetical protein
MTATLIHPLDLAVKTLDTAYIHENKFYDDLIEINGELFYQTIRAPRVSNEIA